MIPVSSAVLTCSTREAVAGTTGCLIQAACDAPDQTSDEQQDSHHYYNDQCRNVHVFFLLLLFLLISFRVTLVVCSTSDKEEKETAWLRSLSEC